MAIQIKIDKLKTLRECLNKIADSYGSFIRNELVTIQLHAENTDLSAYKVKVVNTTSGNEEFYDISASGYTEFEVNYGAVYEIVFPIIGVYITPATRTFTAQKPIRKMEASYVMAGVFGLDAQGNKYSLAQIEALEDKSIIKYGGFADYDLENAQKADGTYGCCFMWELEDSYIENILWCNKEIEFDQELLPFITTNDEAIKYCDGEAYTRYIISEGIRLSATVPAAEWCNNKTILINGISLQGYMIAPAQGLKLIKNLTHFNELYTTLSKEPIAFRNNLSYLMTSGQQSSTTACIFDGSGVFNNNRYASKTRSSNWTIRVFKLI